MIVRSPPSPLPSHAVKKLIVTDLDFDGSARRAEVVVRSSHTHALSVAGGGGDSGGGPVAAVGGARETGGIRAGVRRALGECGVRPEWATVEVE